MQSDKEKIKNKESKISQQNHIIEEICENGNIQYNCTACRKIFRSRSQKYYHLNCNQLENKLYKCEHCDKSFARLPQWKYHIESHLSPINECLKCQKIFSNPLALKKHVALHNVELKMCPHCDKTFKKKISMEHHIAAQHLNQLQYGCAYCCKKYSSKSSLQLHLQTHEEKHFECSFCGKLFQRNSILNQHLKRHYNTNNYICTICQKVFSESGALARHRKTHEENILQYHCKLCDKNILRKDNMTRHLNTIHPEERFENIVDIIKVPMKMIHQSNVGSKESVINFIENEHRTNVDKNIVIIENKLLQKPFELKDSMIDLPINVANNIGNKIKYPLLNQIKVITAVPTYKEEMLSKTQEKDFENSKNCNKSSTLQVATTCYLKQIENEHKEQTQNDSNKFLNQMEQESQLSKLDSNIQSEKVICTTDTTAVLNPSQSIINFEIPETQTISSVIRSIGNVKKNLTLPNVIPVKLNNKTCLEYKHKKYCRTNYNIDLYRKILGCDDDGDEIEQNKEQEQNSVHLQMEDNLLKSPTPVHWRKSFKNNYETSSS